MGYTREVEPKRRTKKTPMDINNEQREKRRYITNKKKMEINNEKKKKRKK